MPSDAALIAARRELINAGFSPDEAEGIVAEVLVGEAPGTPSLVSQQPLSAGGGLEQMKRAAQVVIPGVASAAGGSLARMGLVHFAPKAAPYVGPLVSGVGEATGSFLGSIGTGVPPKEAVRGAAITGGVGVGVEGGLQALGRGFSRAGRVTPRTVRETQQQGGFNRLRTTFRGVGDREYLEEAKRLERGSTLKRVDKSPGRMRAESKMRDFDVANPEQTTTVPGPPVGFIPGRQVPGAPQTVTQGPVDFEPIRQRILSLVDDRATSTGRIAVNNQLRGMADRIPESGTMDDLDFFIREQTEPIRGQVQNLEAALPASVQQRIVSFARGYRNRILPEARRDFAAASRYLAATKRIRSMLVDKSGNLRRGVEGVWRQIPRNKVVMEAFENYDKVHGTNFANRALDLARRANWSPGDGATALGMLDAGVGWWGRAAATTSRAVGKVLTISAIPAGRIAAGMTAASESEKSRRIALRANP